MCVIEEIKHQPNDKTLYYVHYIDFDRRLDKWVDVDYLDLNNIKRQMTPTEWNSLSRKKITRSLKRKYEELNFTGMSHSRSNEDDHDSHVVFPKNIDIVVLGKYEIEAWYFSPYPSEITNNKRKIYVCEYCLKYVRKKKTLLNHFKKCNLQHPPGDEIYRDENLSFWEVNGSKQRLYCQNLCLLAKLFLEEKNVYCDVDGFLFYLLTEYSDGGYHIVGYFSKEKNTMNNLACILTFPPFQRKGYGKYVIQFSYALSKKEGKPGSPERPLSDLGALGYHSYWDFTILDVIKKHNRGKICVEKISKITSMTIDDILETFERLNIIRYSKGQQIVSVSESLMREHEVKSRRFRKRIILDNLHWSSYDYKFIYSDV